MAMLQQGAGRYVMAAGVPCVQHFGKAPYGQQAPEGVLYFRHAGEAP